MASDLLANLRLLQHASCWRLQESWPCLSQRSPQTHPTGKSVYLSSQHQPSCKARRSLAEPSTADTHGVPEAPGLNAKGRKTLAHPDYVRIQSMWYPTRNHGKLPADFTHKSVKKVWLRCPGCLHGCGRHHEWAATPSSLTQYQGRMVCPSCESRRSFCVCRSVAADPTLIREWHPNNPLASRVAQNSRMKCEWLCPKGHPPYKASCRSRFQGNTGCPMCHEERRGSVRHPVLSLGREDLAEEWHPSRNSRSPGDVTLGSNFNAWWVCVSNTEHPPWQARVFDRALMGKGCPACAVNNRFKPRLFGSAEG